jgi:glycosyltransferase involved in cell wall biosynthesis
MLKDWTKPMNPRYDLLCLSHLRWDFVFQRPHHLLSRFDRGRVLFFEEPVYGVRAPGIRFSPACANVTVVTPELPDGLSEEQENRELARLLDQLLESQRVTDYISWYYTPMALGFSQHLRPLLSVYDCMDQLSHFRGADPRLSQQEKSLFEKVDLVFTGGVSLFEDKRNLHPRVYAFPSSVDISHFARAREILPEPDDMKNLPVPRVGYFGVIDERIDLGLLDGLARELPDVQFVMVGPLCKIEESDLPRRPNLHYLGAKSYQQLPEYLSSWQVAMMPFAINDATRFISPTKTPEYLAGGRPVVSTRIRDVVRPYQELGLVRIADTAPTFAQAIVQALYEDPVERLKRADDFLATQSWDNTWAGMQQIVEQQMVQIPGTNSERILHV